MGLEATCAATLDGATSHGKALLETTELLFRASSGNTRARVPLGEVQRVTVSGKKLTLKWRGGTLALDLGLPEAARKWAEKIKNPPSRMGKLGVKPGRRVALVGSFAFDATFADELAAAGAAAPGATAGAAAGADRSGKGLVDVLFYSVTKRADLERIEALTRRIDPAGALWIVRPKGKDTPVTESDTRRAGLDAGLVDVKVAAFSATHTGEKFVVPLAKRR